MNRKNLRSATGLSQLNLIENLEGRTMMSAALPAHAALAAPPHAALGAAVNTVVVNTVQDRIDAAGTGIVSFRDAVASANASKVPTTIQFSPTVFGSAQTITLTLGKLELTNAAEPVTVIGAKAGLTISGNHQANGLVIDASVTANVSGLAIVNCTSRGILNNGKVTLNNVLLSNDSGGGLKNNGSAVLSFVTLQSNNSVTDYGAGLFNAGTATLDNVMISGNSATSNYGGGIYNSGTLTLSDVTVSGNTLTGFGGGGIANQGTLSATNVTVANNTSSNYGGGVYNPGLATFNESTIAGNSGKDFGGGLFTYYGGNTTLSNTIVANNICLGIGDGQDVYGVTNSAGRNLIGKTDGSSGWVGSDLTGTVASPRNAMLGSLAYNGGFTKTMLPLAGSPAINNGNNAALPSNVVTDQRGLTRVIGGTVDIGAVEVQNPPPNPVSIATRYGNELVITASGTNDTVTITENGSTLTIVADGQTFTDAAPAAGLFVYTRGGADSITVASSVAVRTTIDSIDSAPTTISSAGANVIAWVDSTDMVSGSSNVHAVASFAGGVSKAKGASLANPTDSGATATAKLSLFGTGPTAADINQGAVGDCYFMASLAAFANQRPQALLNSAVDLGDGTYAVEFYSSGKPVFVRVNNSFPVGGFNGWNFAHPGAGNTMWGMVMEKAFAYFRYGDNTYASINSGWMSDVYADLNVQAANLTPGTFTDAQLFNMLSSDLNAGDPITMATGSAPDLVNGHAYTLIGVQTVNGVNQYIVRNPWGVSGDSLENSQGIAVLSYQQFVNNYYDVTIATT